MNVLLYNSYNLFFPQYLNTERSTYQLFCNTALRALLHQLKAYYGDQKCLFFFLIFLFLWEITRMGVRFVFFSQLKQSAGNTQNWDWMMSSSLPLHQFEQSFLNTSKTKHQHWQRNACPPQAKTSLLRALSPSFGGSLVGQEELQTVGKGWFKFSVTTAKRELHWTSFTPCQDLGGYFCVHPKN